MAGRTRPILPPARPSKDISPGGLWGCPKTDAAVLPCAWRCKRANNTFAAKRPPATSAPPALPANLASMYACYHGPGGLRQIARHVHLLTSLLARGLARLGYDVGPAQFFDTIRVGLGHRNSEDVLKRAEARRMNLRRLDGHTLGISLDRRRRSGTSWTSGRSSTTRGSRLSKRVT